MADWSKDGKPMSFWELTGPICEAIKTAYELVPRDYGDGIPWNGPQLPESMKGGCFEYDEKLSRFQLEYSENDQGRDPLEEIVGIAIQLGMEQGRRRFQEDGHLELAIQMLEHGISSLKIMADRGH